VVSGIYPLIAFQLLRHRHQPRPNLPLPRRPQTQPNDAPVRRRNLSNHHLVERALDVNAHAPALGIDARRWLLDARSAPRRSLNWFLDRNTRETQHRSNTGAKTSACRSPYRFRSSNAKRSPIGPTRSWNRMIIQVSLGVHPVHLPSRNPSSGPFACLRRRRSLHPNQLTVQYKPSAHSSLIRHKSRSLRLRSL